MTRNIGTEACQLIPVTVGKTKLLVLDTPGFDDSKRTDTEILTEIARVLSAQYELGVQLKGIIYIHRITDVRYGGTAIKTFEVFKKICGEDALKNVLLVTSRWNEVDATLGADRERQLREKFWAFMIGRGSNISRFHGDEDSAQVLASQLLCKDPIVLELQRELVDEGKNLDETVAGSFVSGDLDRLKKKYEQELADLEKLKQELRDSDRKMKRDIQRQMAEEQARLQATYADQVSLQRPVGKEVQKEIGKKRSMITKALPFLPVAVSILGAFVGIPPGVTDIVMSWFGGSDLSGLFSG